jgi:predicted nuclease of predicted toxin-antitoxin system
VAGHDAVHAADLGLASASDLEIIGAATEQSRVVVSADTDLGTLLAARHEASPSVLLIRLRNPRRATELGDLLLANIESVAEDLDNGAVVVLEDERIRVRRLPI